MLKADWIDVLLGVAAFILGLLATPFASAFGAALVGRAVWHLMEVQHSRRSLVDPVLVLDVSVCLMAVIVGLGVVSYFGFDSRVLNAVVAVLAYLGPRGAEAHLRRAADKWMSPKR